MLTQRPTIITRHPLYRPNRPWLPDGSLGGGDAREPDTESSAEWYWRVFRERYLVAAYFVAYFRSAREVLDDIAAMIQADKINLFDDDDFTIWYGGRLQAVFHDGQATIFDEHENPPIAHEPPPGWPSLAEWIAQGRGDIVVSPKPWQI